MVSFFEYLIDSVIYNCMKEEDFGGSWENMKFEFKNCIYLYEESKTN
jgi:hypothetical protein